MTTLKYTLIFIVGFCSLVHARTWEKIDIPQAVCGNGAQYSVFLDRKNSDKLLIEFMGGGACWSESTCYGNTPLTSLNPLKEPVTSVIAKESATNPWSDHSVLYLPYCTGDVHSGNHVAYYKPQLALHHNGYRNILLTFEHLHRNQVIQFAKIFKVTVYGSSAGALGAFVHGKSTIEPYLNPLAKKLLIADSPGLHFGNTFWDKFSARLNQDYKDGFNRAGLNYPSDEGLLAPYMGPVFLKLFAWEIGILQGTKDLVMSMVFGDISPDAHRSLVLGPKGIQAAAKLHANVETWISESVTHTFLLRGVSHNQKDLKGESAWSFANRLYGAQ
ncbi:pectinacetylesterase family protein [Bdellovibrio reynosensis]|uniref:Pectinacetylesterase family protein n=1 Tax=Bdellovibrio reynosensis TaxID=2835041 RepID=A0ABY4C7G3_9BACT|nr:pectinacetylesterase family protein [Bdellovibrio reynosensis]UOF00923.1 pectinacetylesterase family protein [Bdellovibrio reynosensis]